MLKLNTACPGVIDSFDAETQTATVLPAIQMRTNIDNEIDYVDLPPILNVPVVFPFVETAGFALTLPIKQGDNCLLIFSQRGLDNWHQSGGVQPPEEGVGTRHHDITDALAILSPSHLGNVLGAWESDGIEIRNRAKNSRITLKDDEIVIARGSSVITVTDTEVTIDATDVTVDATTTTFTGAVEIQGATTMLAGASVTGAMTNNAVNIGSTHTHTQGVDSRGDTQANTGSPV